MTRRRLVAIVSAGAILAVALVVTIVFVSLTQTTLGREYIRDILRWQVASRMGKRGTMYVGRISGGLLNGVTIDSFAIRDAEDSLFLSTGPVHITYDPRDLIDRRLLFRTLKVERPFVNLRRHANGDWNYRRIFPSGPKRLRSPQRRYGDYIVIDSSLVTGGTLVLTLPWAPPDSLTGARRDSAVRAALAAEDVEIRATAEGLKRTRRWTGLDALLPYVRIADPDSSGRLFSVAHLDVTESDPPFRFRNVSGPVRMLGDTVWFEARHFDLAGSSGSASGRVYWGSGPMRYDVHVVGDSVSLADVGWVYPTLPRAGGGKMELRIKNNARDPNILEYAISKMDLRSTASHLKGAMTFGVGGPVVILKDVDIRADPLDFALVRTFNGAPLPVDWRGQITGTIRARGGPLNRWIVDDAQFAFRDAHVPGAITRGSASGGLDILFPAFTVFRGFDVELQTLDLRTVENLFPEFPRLGGTLSGRATLDSSWLDVRFKNADVTHRNGPDPPSRATGNGRVTLGDEFLTFDLDVQADPLSFTTLARSYPVLPLRGAFVGPLRVRGTVEDLDLAGRLTGEAGTLSVDGHFDLFPSGYAARAAGGVRDLNLRALLGRVDLPATSLNASFTSDVRGDSLANLEGAVELEVDRSRVDDVRIFPSIARLAFANGIMLVDTLHLETSAATVLAEGGGGLGLRKPASDTLHFTVRVDSLGGLRRWILPDTAPPRPRPASVAANGGTVTPVESSAWDPLEDALADSLAGTVSVTGELAGSLDSSSITGSVGGSELFVAGNRASNLTGRISFAGLPSAPRGALEVRFDTAATTGGGLRFQSVTVAGFLAGRDSGRVSLGAVGINDTQARLSASITMVSDTVAVVIDTLGLLLKERHWALAAPGRITMDSSGVVLDSLSVRDGERGRVSLAGVFPNEGALSATLAMENFPLSDAGLIAQTRSALAGTADLDLSLSGTRSDPIVALTAAAQDVHIGEVRLPFVRARGNYAARKLEAAMQLYRDSIPVLTLNASLPVDLALRPVESRLPEEPLSVALRADSVDFSIIEAVSPQFQRVTGMLSATIDVGGTWRKPSFAGGLEIRNGETGIPRLGIRLRNLNTDIALSRDSISIKRLSAQSGPQRGDTLAVGGVVKIRDATDYESAVFDVRLFANHFQAIQRRRVADLEISGQLHLTGPYEGARLAGGLVVDRGIVYLPERAQKQIVSLADSDAYEIIDTTLVANQGLLPRAPIALVKNLTVDNVRIAVGDNVWLRSAEANIKLGGGVEVTSDGSELALAGNLQANRGTYRLDLGPVQRTFIVDRGQIRFFGRADIPAELDISASYTVRQINRQDVRIRAHIGGSLAQLRLNLTTDERIPISPTEILSYLVFGAPTFVAADNTSALRPVAQALLPTLGGVLERALSDQLGSLVDIVTIQAGNVGTQSLLTRGGAGDVLSGTRIGVGGQLSERTFVTVNAGLCKLGSLGGANTANQSFTESLGFTVEHRLNHGFSVQAGVEPASTALLCGRRGELNIPRQLGFDLFREWSF